LKEEGMMTRAQKARKEVEETRKSMEMEKATEEEMRSPEGLIESMPKKQRIGHEDQNGRRIWKKGKKADYAYLAQRNQMDLH
jgi:hypothetical protein